MRGRSWGVVALFAALLALGTFVLAAVPATGAAICLRIGGCGPERDLLELEMQGSEFSPTAMPSRRFAPVAFKGKIGISMSGGSHPPALRGGVLTVDKDVDVNVSGLPVCGYRKIASRTSEEARRACRRAIVGSGEATIQLAYPGTPPTQVETPLIAFNGGFSRGHIHVHVHAFVAAPLRQPVVAQIRIRRWPGGQENGWHVMWRVPEMGGGYGSLIASRLNLKRFFFDHGERKSFLSAKCPDGEFRFSMPRLDFRNEAEIPSMAPRTVLRGNLAVPCKPKG